MWKTINCSWNWARAPLTAPVSFQSIYIKPELWKIPFEMPFHIYLKDMQFFKFLLKHTKSEPWTIISSRDIYLILYMFIMHFGYEIKFSRKKYLKTHKGFSVKSQIFVMKNSLKGVFSNVLPNEGFDVDPITQ